MRASRLAAFLVALGVCGCAGAWRHATRFEGVVAGELDDLDPPSLALAAERTWQALEKQPHRSWVLAGTTIETKDLIASAKHVARLAREETDAAHLTARLARECLALPAAQPAKVTAYYEPVLSARRAPDARFRHAIYRLPSPTQLAGLREKLGRAPARADIDRGGALEGLGLELAWTDDPVALFFLHVQGSGRLRFEDGAQTRIGFAGTNELAYRSIGAEMVAKGLLEKDAANAPQIRAWLAAHPERREDILFRNERYVFFAETAEGPVGSLGVTLVPGRSIASDDRFVPRGSLAWLRAARPVIGADGRVVSKAPLTRFVFAQDSGAAIKGPGRVDLFAGSGDRAGLEAGYTNEAGEIRLLLCRD